MRASEHDVQTSLYDDAYRYAFRRSVSAKLATAAALEAVEALEAAGPAATLASDVPGSPAKDAATLASDVPGSPAEDAATPAAVGSGTAEDAASTDRTLLDDTAAQRVALFALARAALERYLPPTLPPRVEGAPDLQNALAALSPGERELLLLHHWEGLGAEDAARASGQHPGGLSVIEARCARLVFPDALPAAPFEASPGALSTAPAEGFRNASPGAFAAVLAAADPARSLTEEDIARSRRSASEEASSGTPLPGGTAAQGVPLPLAVPEPSPADDRGSMGGRSRRFQATVGAVCLVAIVAVLAAVLMPRPAPGPAAATERLFDLADVVVVVAASGVGPGMVDGDLRMLQTAPVVQVVKGDAAGDVLTIDVTGRSTLERPYSRNFYAPDQLMFLVRGRDGVLSPIGGEGSVLTLIDRRSPEARTTTGDPAPLPDELSADIQALPEDELTLDTSGRKAGSLDAHAVVGILPSIGRDAQNLPDDQLGDFRISAEGERACVVFEFTGRAVLLRWPEGFSVYEHQQFLSYPNGDPLVGRRVLTVLNDRGYPYVDENRTTPFIRGAPTGGRGECGGRTLEIWDIAVEPGSTLLFY